MSTFVLRLQPARPSFALDATDSEREIMGRHAAHWQSYIVSGQMVVFGPILEEDRSFGLAVLEAADEDELRRHAAEDPAVTSGLAQVAIGTMLTGFVRPA